VRSKALSELIILAGPNGSGKSTLTKSNLFDCPVVDPDAIARELPPEQGVSAERQAGKNRTKHHHHANHRMPTVVQKGNEFIVIIQSINRRACQYPSK
jgi:predicted ABC-type ATPase